MADAFEDRLEKSLDDLKQDEKVGSKVDVAADHRFVGLRRLSEAARQRRRRGAALHAAPLPSAAPAGRGRGRQARLRREAGRRRCAGRPLGARDAARWRRRRTCRSSRAFACATTTASARSSAGSTTARSARSLTLMANDYRSGRWAKPKQPGLDRDDLPDAQLVQLHLALRRLQRRAARPLSSTSAPGS